MKYSFLIAALSLLSACSRDQLKENHVSATFHAEELPPNHKVDLSQRKVFPYSVVPGGTINQAEVKAKVANDAAVRDHYKGIDLDKLKPFRLTQPARGYVSYRVGNRIFWTSQRLYLKAGEILLSDGVNVLRGRCGNRVSLEARLPVRIASEPKEAVLDLPSWDTPVFQAMVHAANHGADELSLLLPGNGPQGLISIYADLPPAMFAVAPQVVPGIISGVLPVRLQPSLGDSGFTLYSYPPIFYVATQPVPILPSSITPIENVLNLGLQAIIPTVLLPPTYVFPPTVSIGNPTIEVVALTPLPYTGEPGPPALPVPTTLLETRPPPAFEPIPEPSTLLLVSAAAVLLLLKRKR